MFTLDKQVQVTFSKEDIYEVIEGLFLADPIEMLADLLHAVFHVDEVCDGVSKWAEKLTPEARMQLVEKLIGQENKDWVAAVRADEKKKMEEQQAAMALATTSALEFVLKNRGGLES